MQISYSFKPYVRCVVSFDVIFEVHHRSAHNGCSNLSLSFRWFALSFKFQSYHSDLISVKNLSFSCCSIRNKELPSVILPFLALMIHSNGSGCCLINVLRREYSISFRGLMRSSMSHMMNTWTKYLKIRGSSWPLAI